MLLNDYYRTLYRGRLIVRFDDTNPAKEKTEFEEAILEDLARLGVRPDVVTHTSDNFAYILGKARQLIAQGDAYVDDQDKEVRCRVLSLYCFYFFVSSLPFSVPHLSRLPCR